MRRTLTPRVLGVLASLALGLSLVGAPAQAIKGGSTVADGVVPSMAAVLIDGGAGGLCGGVLLGPRAVLTAAHCVTSSGVAMPTADLTVGLGETDLTDLDPDEIYRVTSVRVDPSYNVDTFANDVAVLVLQREGTQSADGGPVEPGALITPGSYPLWDEGSSATIAGWGVTETASPSDLLRIGTAAIASDTTCGTSSSTLFCTNAGAEVCAGDSGGPLFVSDGGTGSVVAGITLFGETDCSSSGRDYFARLAEEPLASWVRAELDTDGPGVVAQTPTGRKVKRSANVVVSFSEPVDVANLPARAISLSRLTRTGAVKVSGTLSVNASGTRATFNPFGRTKKLLAAGSRYRVSVGAGITDAVGNRFDQKPGAVGYQLKKWVFTTRR